MKKIALFTLALCVLGACAKEAYSDKGNIRPAGDIDGSRIVSFTATIPEFEPASKASVDNTSFAWEDGDQIAIPSTSGYAIFTTNTDYGLGTFKCTLKDGEELSDDSIAVYPASVATGEYSTEFSSISAAKSAFKMEGKYTKGASSISFDHNSALVHLTFTNVPSFANKLLVNDGAKNVATITFSGASGTVDFYVPIDPDGVQHTYTFDLQEGDNVIRRAQKEVTLVKDTYYTARVAVGKVITIQNNAGWEYPYLDVSNGSQSYRFNSAAYVPGATYPSKLNLHTSGFYYAVLNNDIPWLSSVDNIGVLFNGWNGSARQETKTECVFLNRNIDFVVPEGGGLKTDYRIYPTSGTTTSVNVFITQPLKLTREGWDNVQLYWWSDKTGNKVEPWGNWDVRRDDKNWLSGTEFDIPTSLVGYANDSGLIIGNLNDVHYQYNTYFLGDIHVNMDTGAFTPDLTTKRKSDEWPGNPLTGISSSVGPYLSFQDLYGATNSYGDTVWVIVSDASDQTKQTEVQVLVINRDYKINL